MSFASPGYLALLALAPLAAVAYLALARWRRRAAQRFAPGQHAPDLSTPVSSTRRTLKAALVLSAIAIIAVALAGPRLGQQETVLHQSGADVVIALDVSRSMLAADVAPTRLALAQEETLALLDRLRGHRVALVIFARSALLRAPLTTDTSPVQTLVRSAQQESVLLAPGSDIGAAIRTAVRALEAGEAESKAIVLVTDGEDHEGDALAAAQDAVAQGVVLYTAGLGTATGAPVPPTDPETGFVIPAGEVEGETSAITRQDEALLRRMASISPKGVYAPGEELAELAGAIDRLERTPFATERQERPIERFQWAVLAALTLLALEVALPERRIRWPRPRLPRMRLAPRAGGLVALVALALLAGSCGSNIAGLIDEGNRAWDQGDREAALEAYRRAGASAPDRPEPHLNAGLVLHELERYPEAVLETSRALPIDNPDRASLAHFNLGNHYLRMGRLIDALDSYREALLLNPDDEDAKHNLEIAWQLLRLAQATPSQDAAGPSSGDSEGDPGTSSEGDPDAGEGAGAEGGAGDPAGQAEVAQRALEEALEGIDEEFTVEEALRVLDLIQELNRLQTTLSPSGGTGDPEHLDY